MIQTIKTTEIQIGKVHLTLPHDKSSASSAKPQPAFVVFETPQGTEKIAIELCQWRQVRKNVAILTVKIM